MSSARSNRVVGLGRALAFGVTAWRDLWVVLILSSIGPGVMFLGEHAPVSRDLSMMLMLGGLGWTALMMAPTMGGLYRGALTQFAGPRGRRFNLGLAGLQWTRAEWRLIGLGVLMFLLAVLFLAPAGLAAGGVTWVLRTQTDLNLMTSLRYGAFAGLAVMALYPLVALRIALGGAATVAEDRISLFQTWPLTHRRMGVVAGMLLLVALLYPMALLTAAAVNNRETGAFDLSTTRWPLEDAVWGALASGLFHGALMPALFAGVLTRLYMNWRPQPVADELKKPTLRVTADFVETAAAGAVATEAEPSGAASAGDNRASETAADAVTPSPEREGVVIPFSRPFRRDDKLAASLELDGPDEDLHPVASAFQIGADRIRWPSEATEHSPPGAAPPPAVDVPMPDLSRVLAVWPELGLAALQFGKSAERPTQDERHDGLSVADDGPAPTALPERSIFPWPETPQGLDHPSLEHPMLLAPCAGPAREEPAGQGPASDSGDALGDTYFWWDVDPRRAPELFHAVGAMTPTPDTPNPILPEPDATHLASEPAPSETGQSEAGEPRLLALPTPVALPPGLMAAPPPTQVVAFVAPRPFDGSARLVADAAAANDLPGVADLAHPPPPPGPSFAADLRDVDVTEPVEP